MREHEGLALVKEQVDQWSSVYINQVFFEEERDNILIYVVEFSKPHMNKPIPEGTVKVIFYIIQGEEDDYEIEFNFENESLRHTPDKTMRSNMYQQWIDRVIENKHKIKQQLHLGTEFEYTRFVDKKGQFIDPFVPKFDITKMQDLEKVTKQSQKINVESPRFISTLERALVKLFEEADVPTDSVADFGANEAGELNYSQFYHSYKKLPYNLSENDVRMLLAIADENPNGKISWREFIPVCIDAIKTFLARNKFLAKNTALAKPLNLDTMKLIFEKEIEKAVQMIVRKIEVFDTDKETKEHSGFVSFEVMQNIFTKTSFLTTKECNLLLREYVMKYGYEKIKYTDLADDLLQVRFELLKNRTSATNIETGDDSKSEKVNIEKIDAKQFFYKIANEQDLIKPMMPINELRAILYRCRKLVLTPLQVTILLGFSEVNAEGMIDIEKFSPIAAEVIMSMFTVEPMRRKSQMIQLGLFKPEHVQMPHFEDLDLFKVFRDCDENAKGFLEPTEFTYCLQQFKPLALSQREIITLTLLGDCDLNERIAYQDFMKHFREFLYLIKFHAELQAKYDEELRIDAEAGGQMNEI